MVSPHQRRLSRRPFRKFSSFQAIPPHMSVEEAAGSVLGRVGVLRFDYSSRRAEINLNSRYAPVMVHGPNGIVVVEEYYHTYRLVVKGRKLAKICSGQSYTSSNLD